MATKGYLGYGLMLATVSAVVYGNGRCVDEAGGAHGSYQGLPRGRRGADDEVYGSVRYLGRGQLSARELSKWTTVW